MKAIILAAGKGERLRGIVNDVPKPMIKIRGKPILERNIEWLKGSGFREFCINLHHLADVIRNYFGDGSRWEVKIVYSYEPELLGTAGAVRKIVRNSRIWKAGNDFLVVYGDNYYPWSYSLRDFIKFHFRKGGLATLGLYEKKSEILKSGVVILGRGNLIIEFIEKPDLKNTNLKIVENGLINTGLYVLNRKIIDYLPVGFSDFGRDIFPNLMNKKIPIYGYVFGKPLIAIDTVELYKKAINC